MVAQRGREEAVEGVNFPFSARREDNLVNSLTAPELDGTIGGQILESKLPDLGCGDDTMVTGGCGLLFLRGNVEGTSDGRLSTFLLVSTQKVCERTICLLRFHLHRQLNRA